MFSVLSRIHLLQEIQLTIITIVELRIAEIGLLN